MNMTPEQLREIALRVACEKAMMFGKDEIVSFAAALFAEFQKLPEGLEPVAVVDDSGVIIVCRYDYKPGDKLYSVPPDLTKRIEEAEEIAFRASEAHVVTMQRAMTAEAKVAELEGALHAEKYAHSGSNAAKFEAWRKCDELAAQNAQLREALEIVIDCRPIGYETLTAPRERKIRETLALPDLASSILRKRDTQVLRNAAKEFVRQGYGNWAVLDCMAAELEAGK